jgi:D-3-phosphoglycerate dehydrogenase
MKKILANDGIDESGKIILEKAGYTVVTEKIAQENLAEALNKDSFDAILVRSATTVRKDLIDKCPGLKLIGRGGVGMDNIDVQYAKDKGIEVINTPAASSQSVAELVFAHLFSMARFLYDSNRKMPLVGNTEFNTLKKNYAKGVELRGKTLGIIGFGRIGQSVAQYALGCGMKVLCVDSIPKTINIEWEIHGYGKVSVAVKTVGIDELLANSDFITLHVPKQKDGGALLGRTEMEKMKKGVCLVNTSRGGSIDEKALIEYLNNGKIAHAALDVFENEPTPAKEILEHKKISLSPHIGASTIEAQDRIGVELAEKIIAFFK